MEAINFKLRVTDEEGNESIVDPRWVEVQVKNNICPQCRSWAIEINNHSGLLTLWCTLCHKVYQGMPPEVTDAPTTLR